jgi:hypothetical protein
METSAGKETGLVIRLGKKSDDQRLSRGAESGSVIARSNVVRELFDEVRTGLSLGGDASESRRVQRAEPPFRPVLVDCITHMFGFDLAHCRAELTNCDTTCSAPFQLRYRTALLTAS